MLRTEQQVAQLLSLISHEVRGPLGVVRGYLRLLEQQGTTLTDAHRHAVAAALKAGDRATEILAQVSALARFESGEAVPTVAATPLPQLLESTANALTLPTEPRVTLQLGTTPSVLVPVDEPLMRVALTGLMAAVIRAQAADGSVHVLAREKDEGASRGVTITITTIKPVSGSQTHAPLDLRRGGLGLDLPIAASIVAAHNGNVRELRDEHRFMGVVVWLPVA